MELPVSDKTGSNEKKPRIKKGYYAGQFLEAKPRQKNDGTPIEGKFGKQIVMLFSVHNPDTYADIEYAPDPTHPNIKKTLVLAQVLNSEYKNDDGTGYHTAVTPNSKLTQVLMALGWQFDAKKNVNIDALVGNWVELNIDDYALLDQNKVPTGEMASSIKDIKALSPEAPTPPKTAPIKPAPISNTKREATMAQEINEEIVEDDVAVTGATKKELEEKLHKIKLMFVDGQLTQEGYTKAKEQLEKQINALK